MKAFLPLALLATQVAAAPLESTQTLTGEVILPVAKLSVSDTSPDGASPLMVETRTLDLQAFSPAQGVLVGVQGRLGIEPDHGLMAYRNESGGDWDSISTLRAGWSLNGQALGPATTVLQRVVSNRDTPVVIGTTWASLDFDRTTGLDSFVGAGALSPIVTTSIGAFISDGGGGSTAIASVLAMVGGVGGPDTDGLTAGISWTYRWLRHAQLSFDAGAAQGVLGLDVGAGAAGFSVHALGDAATTNADLLGWTCSGDCAAFSLQLNPATGLAAGAELTGEARFVGGPGQHAATFALLVADDATVGAAASRGTQTLFLELQASAVPEPRSALMLLAGLGLLGMTCRRSRPG